jgi:hypothetical protein
MKAVPHLLILVLLSPVACPLPAWGETGAAVLERDPRMGKRVELLLIRTPLDEVLKACSDATGVRCDTRSSAVDLRVSVLTKEQPLSDVLTAIGKVLNLDLVPRYEGAEWKYSLIETEASRGRLNKQIREDRAVSRRAFLALLASAAGEPVDGPDWLRRAAQDQASHSQIATAARLAAALPPAVLGAALEGRPALVPVSQLTPQAQQLAGGFLQAQRALSDELYEARARDGLAAHPGAEPRPVGEPGNRSLRVVFEGGTMSVGVVGPRGAGGGMISIPAAGPGYADAIGDLQHFGAREVHPRYHESPVDWPSGVTWEKALLRLHSGSGWNLVTDALDPEQARQVYPEDRERLAAEGVERTLDGLSFAFHRRWTSQGAILGFRTNHWYSLRESQIPERLARRWRAEAKEHGCYSLATLAEMASLNRSQIIKLRAYAGTSAAFSRQRMNALRLFHQLSPQRRKKALADGVLLSDLSREQLGFLQDLAELTRPDVGRREFGAQPIGVRYREEGGVEPTVDMEVLFRDRKTVTYRMKTKAAPKSDPWTSYPGG